MLYLCTLCHDVFVFLSGFILLVVVLSSTHNMGEISMELEEAENSTGATSSGRTENHHIRTHHKPSENVEYFDYREIDGSTGDFTPSCNIRTLDHCQNTLQPDEFDRWHQQKRPYEFTETNSHVDYEYLSDISYQFETTGRDKLRCSVVGGQYDSIRNAHQMAELSGSTPASPMEKRLMKNSNVCFPSSYLYDQTFTQPQYPHPHGGIRNRAVGKEDISRFISGVRHEVDMEQVTDCLRDTQLEHFWPQFLQFNY